MVSGRTLVAVGVSLAGLGAGLSLGLRQHGPWRHPEAAPLILVDPDAALLDTVRLRGRRVSASLSGTVQAVGAEGTVWLGEGDGAIPLSFDHDPAVAVEDRLLVTGRLRSRGGDRWLEVEGWSRVVGGAQ